MSGTMRWTKLLRDSRAESGRALIMLAAVSFALFAVAAMLSAYGIVTREVRGNYLNSNPAHATIELDAVTPQMLAAAKAFPGIADAEARAVVTARVRVGEQWMRILMFVVDDFENMRLNLFGRVSGAWPPPRGSMLIERAAVPVLGAAEGRALTIKTPHGPATDVLVAGIVHDTTLAPAWQEQSGYGYISRETLASLGEPPVLDELRILLGGNPAMAEIDAKVRDLVKFLRGQGINVHAVKVPPPGQHPHQNQITSGLLMFLSFAVLALVLAAILVAAVLAATLARQVREIGIMKAIGARNGQIAAMYLGLLLLLGGVSVLASLPFGVFVGGKLSNLMAETMNLVIENYTVPVWVHCVVASAGILMPMIAALPAIARASRITVREALASTGSVSSFGAAGLDRMLAALRGLGMPDLLAVRNAFRRRSRLLLALAMLATGGGLFVTALSVRDGWRAMAAHVLADRRYDVEFMFADVASERRVAETLNGLGRVDRFEVWGTEQTAFTSDEGLDLMRTYPDRGHGSFAIFGVPPATRLIAFPMIEGRWLAEDDTDAVVLTQMSLKQHPGLKLGDRVGLSVGGRPTSWTLVGVAREIGGNGAYVPKARYDALAGTAGGGRLVRAALAGHGGDAIAELEKALAGAGLPVERAAPLTMLYAALVGHVEVPVQMLIAAALLLALIGGLGLASMMAVNVLERTRELGIMKAIGALPTTIVRIVIGEGLVVAILGWLMALILALPLTGLIGSLATVMFGSRLPFTLSGMAISLWLAVVIVLALVASAAPAWRASRLIVREALAYN